MNDPVGRTKCGECEKAVTYPLSKAGAKARCPGCKAPITLPDKPAGKSNTHPTAKASPKPAQRSESAKGHSPQLAKDSESHSPPPVPVKSKPAGTIQTHVSTPAVGEQDKTFQTVPVVPVDSEISPFVAEGQNPAMVSKLLNRVREICTSNEEPLYMAVQQRPVVNVSPDAVVLTSRRAIVFRQKMLGRLDFVDCLWMHIHGVHMKENVVGATVSIRGTNGHTEQVDFLPKAQARGVYRIAQEMEEKMIDVRRNRKMEEDRNAATQVNVATAVSPSPSNEPSVPSSGPAARLDKLSAMKDAGLITDEEFQAKRAQILGEL